MNTLEVVLLSLLAGLFLALLLAGGAYLAFDGYRLRKLVLKVENDLPLILKGLEDKLLSQQRLLESQIAKLDGEKLVDAARANIASAKRIEQTCLAFSELAKHLLSGEAIEIEKAVQSGLGAEDYSPNPTGERFVGQSKITQSDAIAEAEQQEELNEHQW